MQLIQFDIVSLSKFNAENNFTPELFPELWIISSQDIFNIGLEIPNDLILAWQNLNITSKHFKSLGMSEN